MLVVDIDLCQLGLRVVKTADQRVDQHADVVVEDVVVLARVEEAGPVEYQNSGPDNRRKQTKCQQCALVAGVVGARVCRDGAR